VPKVIPFRKPRRLTPELLDDRHGQGIQAARPDARSETAEDAFRRGGMQASRQYVRGGHEWQRPRIESYA